jgi:hypothetical protein
MATPSGWRIPLPSCRHSEGGGRAGDAHAVGGAAGTEEQAAQRVLATASENGNTEGVDALLATAAY